MTVKENLAFGLKLLCLPALEVKQRIHEAARMLQIGVYLDHKPK